jgi:hypothetical protein
MNEEGDDIARLTELAIDRLVGALTDEELAEYHALRARHPEFTEADLERSVAVLHLASGVRREPVPERLNVQLAGDATHYFASTPTPTSTSTSTPTSASLSASRGPVEPNRDGRQALRGVGGWLAAAACLVVALVLWEERPVRVVMVPAPTVASAVVRAPESSTPVVVRTAPGTADAQSGSRVADPATPSEHPSEVDPAAQREHLLARNPYVLRRPWRAGNDAAGFMVSGDIVWDPRSQTGFMRFVGLRRNEPNAEQYQLWIFDARRDERYPVDGGVFNITGASQGDVIPIKAALSVGVPLKFAVTIEKPGGVVVSDRTRIAALADTT